MVYLGVMNAASHQSLDSPLGAACLPIWADLPPLLSALVLVLLSVA
jgi:hypothetical protein